MKKVDNFKRIGVLLEKAHNLIDEEVLIENGLTKEEAEEYYKLKEMIK